MLVDPAAPHLWLVRGLGGVLKILEEWREAGAPPLTGEALERLRKTHERLGKFLVENGKQKES